MSDRSIKIVGAKSTADAVRAVLMNDLYLASEYSKRGNGIKHGCIYAQPEGDYFCYLTKTSSVVRCLGKKAEDE